jgi:hypothetical protein
MVQTNRLAFSRAYRVPGHNYQQWHIQEYGPTPHGFLQSHTPFNTRFILLAVVWESSTLEATGDPTSRDGWPPIPGADSQSSHPAACEYSARIPV